MSAVIKKLVKENIPEAVKVVLEAGASSSASEAEKIMNFSLSPGIKPLNPDYYILFLNGELIGVSGLYLDYEDPEDVLWMDYFAVKPEFQLKGYGSLMFNYLEKICEERKVKRLCVFTDSQGALKFYKKKGFKVCGKIKNYYAEKPKIWLNKKIK